MKGKLEMRANVLIGLGVLGTALTASPAFADFTGFTPGNLVVTASTYEDVGEVAGITVGQALPYGGTAVADGSYPNVFNNSKPDGSFGVTSPIILQQLSTSGALINSLNLTDATNGAITTSFSSKSELAVNLSTDGTALTLMGYVAPVGDLDVSNSNTPGHVDPTNPVTSSYQRAVVQIDMTGSVSVTPVDAYSGNNGRAAILANGNFYMVGNAGNGSGNQPTSIVNNTGVQMIAPGGSANTTVVGQQQGTPGSSSGFQYGYSVTQNGYTADKSGKDDNFRGETIYNNTLYVTKGSGSNGVNTVYQVGTAGSLPTSANASSTSINILPGFSTTLAKTAASPTAPASNPFGLWFANSTTLYVGDEGDGVVADLSNGNDPNSGLQKWSLVNGTWKMDYVLQSGLNLGQAYFVNSQSGSVTTSTDGLRNITGINNSDGTVTIYGVTSTAGSTMGDQGADPNKLVAITDLLSATSLPANQSFTTLEAATSGEVLRGVSLAPVPLPGAMLLFGSGLAGLVGLRKKKKLAVA